MIASSKRTGGAGLLPLNAATAFAELLCATTSGSGNDSGHGDGG
eukprot:CAMPEP_0198346270 /NCGR_PEP_ID=MMETSP1450-20131203/78638_1 /TAXON_ID=753684 ORGANISM="Madagascaria erythrocladiodes, Strain CCMP3234" /NCGR_SAMPLE_ID=MMETSP1450 /ASSEMBLY_ACC=CAM_ASM_001115 /LENGTH=43 /DNA_ID= /DNA_START= /DNA_END= /DNA_ORIENTATION=